MRIAIDMQSCQTDSRDRGIGRYVLSLVGTLTRLLRDDDELVICIDATDTQRMRDIRNTLRDKGIAGRIVTYGYPFSSHSNHLPGIEETAGQLRAKFFESIRPDILLISSFFESVTHCTALEWDFLHNVPTAAIVYDLIPLVFPDEYLPEGHLITRWYREKAKHLNKFDLLLAISEATRRDLIEHLAIDPAKIEVVGAGFDQALVPGNSGMDEVSRFAKLGIEKPFVLMVSNRDWRKNTIGAVQAFADLPEKLRREHQLVLTQVNENIHDALKGEYQHLKDQVIVLGKVDEDTLKLLYSKCRAFFFPSFYEGFGLPVLEAMASGAPSLSSCLGALPEVVRNPDMLFDPRNREESSAVLRRVLEDETFRNSLIVGARERALEFTWERCADIVLRALRNHSVLRPRPAFRVDWPTRKDIAVIAQGCLAAGILGEQGLENGLQMIENGDRRRILVDITEIVRLNVNTGIQRVTRNFCAGLSNIARVERRFTVEPFAWTESGIRYARAYARNRLGMDCPGADEMVVSRPNDLVFMLDSSWWSPERFDRLHSATWQLGGEVVWMVYDLIPIRFPQTCEPGMPLNFKSWLSHAVNTADGFICISEATRLDLESFIDESLPDGRRRPWSRSVPLGCDFATQLLNANGERSSKVLKQIRGRPYFATLGTLEPRKDYGTALDALDKLWERGRDVALVMIGKKGWNVDKLVKRIEKHRENGRRLFWLESASDEDVQCLLKGAGALIQTSISEGFGLPLVEAGSQGTPLLLSDIPVFHEIAGEEAVYFPVGNSEALAFAIGQFLQGKKSKRPEAIKSLTWRESTAKLARLLL